MYRGEVEKMENVKHILFDLDGTLTASDEGIIKSVKFALEHFGIYEDNYEKLKLFVGPPLREAFPKYFGLTKEETESAVSLYRERYSSVGLFENDLYEGVKEMLESCKNSGLEIILATSKPKIYAEKILKHFNLYDYFSYVVGSELDGRLDTKAELIEYAMRLCGDDDKTHYVMIGDRFYDVEGAKEHGLRSVGVLYGYGSEEELKAAGATYICRTVYELNELLTG